MRQLDNDVSQIYELLTALNETATEHGDQLESIDARLDGMDRRLDGHDARFDALGAKIDRVLELLEAR